MKVIKYGHIQPKEVKCNHCGAVLEYSLADVGYSQILHQNYIICCVCNNRITSDNNLKPIRRDFKQWNIKRM